MAPDKILVVDDDSKVREMLYDLLTVQGYVPFCAATAQAAQEVIRADEPAVALIDLRLDDTEDTSGLQLLKAIKDQVPALECVVVTGHASQESAIEAINLGAYSYVQKPYDIEQLLVTIRRASEKRATGKALRESEERFSKVFRSSPQPIIVSRLSDGRIVEINRAAREILGYSRDEAVRGTAIELGIVRPAVHEESSRLLEEKGSFRDVEASFYARSGEERTGLFSGETIEINGEECLIQVAVDITGRKRAEELLERRTRQQERLLAAADHLACDLNLEEVLTRIAEGARDILEAHGCATYLLELDRVTLTPVVAIEPPIEKEILATPLQVDNSLTGLAVNARRGLVFNDPLGHEAGHQIPGTPVEEDERIIAVPFVVGDEVLGAMCLNRIGAVFSDEDLALAQAFAQYAATALNNAQAHEALQREVEERKRVEAEARRRAERLAVVNRIANAVSASIHLDDVLETVYQQIISVFQVDAFFLALYDEGTRELDYRIQVDEGKRLPPERLPLGEGLTSRVVIEREPLLVRDLKLERESLPPIKLWGTMRIPEAWLGVPMKVGERVVGVISVQTYAPRVYGDEELLLLSTIADQVATAIESSALFRAEREQRELAEALGAAAAAVSSSLHLDQVLDRILEQVERVVAGEMFDMMLVEKGGARAVRSRGYRRLGLADRTSCPPVTVAECPYLAEMVLTGEPVVVSDTTSPPDWIHTGDRIWRRSYVAAPIQAGGLTVGFLSVSSIQVGGFGPADAERLKAFADHAAAAIENAQLYRELRDHAERLEQRVRDRTTEIRAQYARLEAILTGVSEGIAVTDLTGAILQTNPVAETWLTQTLSPGDASRLKEAVADLAQRADERAEGVLELTGLDLELKAAPISGSGVEGGAVVAIHDVSELKAMDRMKTRFVASVSHELRTPVTTIKLYAELMKRTPPEKWGTYRDMLAQEADRQARIVEDVLHISRIDAGRVSLRPRPISLNEFTEAAVANHLALAREREQMLFHRPSEPGPIALADQNQIMQVFNNLVVNAVRYTPEGGQVVVSTGRERWEGRFWATATVTDTGIGISEDELPRTFERFFRGEKVRSMQIPGTGLGLSIVKEVVELHGGRVTVESEVGSGSAFTVWLPLAAAQE